MKSKEDLTRLQEFLDQTRANVYKIAVVLTGHWPIRDHATRFGISYNSYRRSCGEEGETVRYFFSDYSALAGTWLWTLGKSFVEESKRSLAAGWRRCYHPSMYPRVGFKDLSWLDSAPLALTTIDNLFSLVRNIT